MSNSDIIVQSADLPYLRWPNRRTKRTAWRWIPAPSPIVPADIQACVPEALEGRNGAVFPHGESSRSWSRKRTFRALPVHPPLACSCSVGWFLTMVETGSLRHRPRPILSGYPREPLVLKPFEVYCTMLVRQLSKIYEDTTDHVVEPSMIGLDITGCTWSWILLLFRRKVIPSWIASIDVSKALLTQPDRYRFISHAPPRKDS